MSTLGSPSSSETRSFQEGQVCTARQGIDVPIGGTLVLTQHWRTTKCQRSFLSVDRGPIQLRNLQTPQISRSTFNEQLKFYCQHTRKPKPMFKTNILLRTSKIQNISHRSLLLENKQKRIWNMLMYIVHAQSHKLKNCTTKKLPYSFGKWAFDCF